MNARYLMTALWKENLVGNWRDFLFPFFKLLTVSAPAVDVVELCVGDTFVFNVLKRF